MCLDRLWEMVYSYFRIPWRPRPVVVEDEWFIEEGVLKSSSESELSVRKWQLTSAYMDMTFRAFRAEDQLKELLDGWVLIKSAVQSSEREHAKTRAKLEQLEKDYADLQAEQHLLEMERDSMVDDEKKVAKRCERMKDAMTKLKAERDRVEDCNRKLRNAIRQFGKRPRKRIGKKLHGDIVGDKYDDVEEGVLCSVCLARPLEVMISPCNHVCLCRECSSLVGDSCPICKGKIDERINVYLS